MVKRKKIVAVVTMEEAETLPFLGSKIHLMLIHLIPCLPINSIMKSVLLWNVSRRKVFFLLSHAWCILLVMYPSRVVASWSSCLMILVIFKYNVHQHYSMPTHIVIHFQWRKLLKNVFNVWLFCYYPSQSVRKGSSHQFSNDPFAFNWFRPLSWYLF